MVEVICDTSFLIHLSTRRISNIDSLEMDIGQISFLVPSVVLSELSNLKDNPSKRSSILQTLDFIKSFKTIPIDGSFADREILDYVRQNNSIVATMDKELKRQLRSLGCSIISLSKNKIIFES